MNELSILTFCSASSKSKLLSLIFTDLLTHSRIRRKRPSLRLIVSSATIDASSFLDYFTSATSSSDATIVSLEGRMFPVEVAYLQEPVSDYVAKAASTAVEVNANVCSFLFLIVYCANPQSFSCSTGLGTF